MKTFRQLREETQLDELNLGNVKTSLDRNSDEIRFNGRLKDPNKTLGQRGEPNRGEDPDGWARGGVSTKKRTRYEEYDVEAMLEYIEDLETQLDEVSDELKQRAARKAGDEMDQITGKYPKNTTGDLSIRGVPGITKSDTNKWLKRSKQSSIFKGYNKPKVPRNQAARDDRETAARGYGSGRYQGD